MGKGCSAAILGLSILSQLLQVRLVEAEDDGEVVLSILSQLQPAGAAAELRDPVV
jgi:hypothetical protein